MAMKKDELVARDLAAQGKAIQLGTSDGDVEITENDLAKITDEQLAEFEISRKELHRVFAEGVRLMQSRGVKTVASGATCCRPKARRQVGS
jgi:hypothetical protein